MDKIGVILDYKYLVGDLKGKRYQMRFESMDACIDWVNERVPSGVIEVINTELVELDKLYRFSNWAIEVKVPV